MLLSLISHLLCSWFAFLLPCYSTYKALSYAPLSGELERLSMYWAVIGAFIAVEQSVGPFISWLPFYWEVRTLFLLYISLPQTQGSTYIYKTYFEPFCSKNEADLDAGIESAQNNIIAFCRARISSLIDIFWSLVNKTPITKPSFRGAEGERSRVGGSLDQLKDVWSTYSPMVLATFAPASTPKEAVYVSGTQVGGDNPQERKSSQEELAANSGAL